MARNPVVLHGGDMTIRLMLFWAVFLPTGARFSVDAGRKPAAVQPTRALSLGTAALTFQVCFVYWFAAAFKAHPETAALLRQLMKERGVPVEAQ